MKQFDSFVLILLCICNFLNAKIAFIFDFLYIDSINFMKIPNGRYSFEKKETDRKVVMCCLVINQIV